MRYKFILLEILADEEGSLKDFLGLLIVFVIMHFAINTLTVCNN